MVFGGSPLQAVVAVAQKYEVPIFHPRQQTARLAQLVGGEGRGVILQRCDEAFRALAHGLPVVNDDASVPERRLDLLAELLNLSRIGLPIDLVELP